MARNRLLTKKQLWFGMDHHIGRTWDANTLGRCLSIVDGYRFDDTASPSGDADSVSSAGSDDNGNSSNNQSSADSADGELSPTA